MVSKEKERDVLFLENVVKDLVDHPEDVRVARTVDEMGVLLSLDVNPEDMGKVIGRQGTTAKAVRTLLRIVGMKNNARVNLKINEPAHRTSEPLAFSVSSPTSPSAQLGSTKSAAESVEQAIEDLKV